MKTLEPPTLWWSDAPSFDAALANYRGELQTETETRRELLERYLATHEEKYADGFTKDAAGYVSRSLAAMGVDSWETLKNNCLRYWIGIIEQQHEEDADYLTAALTDSDSDAALQALLLIRFAWPTIEKTAQGHKDMSAKLGLTPEEYAVTDLTDRSRLYAKAKNEHRI